MTASARKRVLRFVGWLLTPFVVWAASFSGGWIVAVATSADRGTAGIVQLGVGSALSGTMGLIVWLLIMRRGSIATEVETNRSQED